MQKTYEIHLVGATALLMHADNFTWAEVMKRWRLEPENKKLSTPGDDRTPAWTWMGSMYHDGDMVGIPSDNLMTAIREGASRVDTGKRGATFKRQSQSGIVVNEIMWPIVTPKGRVAWSDVEKLRDVDDFFEHETAAAKLGFELLSKRAKVGMAKHVRVRPRFAAWEATGTVTVFDETITSQVMEMIWTNAGRYAGLGDWRPSSPKSPGPWGTFTATVKELK